MFSPNMKSCFALTLLILLPIACNDKSEVVLPNRYIRIYPNPAIDDVAIDVTNPTSGDSWTLKVFDPRATIIFEKTSSANEEYSRIDLTGKPKGNYNIVLLTRSANYTQKLLKL
jgi:hypothetical protein